MARKNRILNAAPLNYELGPDDQSVLPQTIAIEEFPLHCPVWYLQTQKGIPGHRYVNASDAKALYGDDSFDLLGKYANHQTVGANICIANANNMYIHRVTAGSYANIQLYLDVLETDVPLYDRNPDGSYTLDSNGERVESGTTVPGYKAKWVVMTRAVALTHSDVMAGVELTGDMTQQAGTMTDGTNTSVLYPMYEVVHSTPGESGNNVGIRHWVPDELDITNINKNNAFIYEFALVEKSEGFSNVTQLKNTLGGVSVPVSFAPRATDSFSGTPMYLPYVIEDTYENMTDPFLPQVVPVVHDIKVYDDDVATVLGLLKPKEDEYRLSVDSPAETWTAEMAADSLATRHLFNVVSGTDIDGVPYDTFVIDETVSTNSVRLTRNNNIMLRGGEDNLMTTAEFEAYVLADIAKYADPNSQYHDHARFVDSMFWDTGFSVDTSADLGRFISSRFDVFIALATFSDDFNNPREALTEAEEVSVATRLLETVRLYPESDYYGTPTMRAMIIGGSGIIRNSSWRRRATLAFDLLDKMCKYMGSSVGRMDPNHRFSRAEGNVITTMKDISIPWVSADQRITNWDVGLNLPLSYGLTTHFWAGLQTVAYDNTVLNSPLTALTVAYLNKVTHKAHRQFTGVDDLSDAELEDAIVQYVADDVFGRFDGLYIIEPVAFHTNADDARGTSWTLVINIYAPDRKTVQTSSVRVYRTEQFGNT